MIEQRIKGRNATHTCQKVEANTIHMGGKVSMNHLSKSAKSANIAKSTHFW